MTTQSAEYEITQAPARPAGTQKQWWALAALLGALFLGNVDVAVANIAGPSIRAGLHASGGELELIVSGYTLAYAVLLVTGARLGEARGYRRMFLAGLGGFTIASLACGLAPTAPALVVARLLAGAAAALMTAQVLTGIQLGFHGRARARALGLYSLVLSAGAVAGQSLGGLLISADVLGATWRPVFLVNVPACLALMWLAWRLLPAGELRPHRLDLPGVAVLSTAMLLLVLPLVLGQDAGWPTWTVVCLAASAPAFVVLWLVERAVSARGGAPLVDPGLLARPGIAWGLASQAVATGTYFAMLFTLALYLQQGLGKSAAYSGLALVSWVAAFGAVLMTLLGLGGLGLGTGFAGMLSHLTSSVPGEYAAGLSGLFNTVTRSGGVIGTAAFGTAYLALVHHPSQAVHGFAVINVALAVTALVAAAMAGLSVRRRG